MRVGTVALAGMALGGCPVILGGPDLSHVDAGGDTAVDDTTSTTETSSTSTTPTDTGPDPLAPLLVGADLAPFVDRLGLSFVVADQDGDLIGGHVTATDGTVVHELAIPADLVKFDPLGTSTARIDAADLYGCDLPYNGHWDVQVTDLAGRQSAPFPASVTVGARGMLPEQSQPYDLGELAPPVLFCVAYDGYGDTEVVFFEVPTAGTYTIQAGWPDVPLDVDLLLYDDGAYNFASAITIGFDYESLTTELAPGVRYRLDMPWYNASGGQPPYTARILIRAD
ncbi:MAG: hypothetical protein R3F59_20735 [Myxococcota bacterium]